jgi:hypothetical protein
LEAERKAAEERKKAEEEEERRRKEAEEKERLLREEERRRKEQEDEAARLAAEAAAMPDWKKILRDKIVSLEPLSYDLPFIKNTAQRDQEDRWTQELGELTEVLKMPECSNFVIYCSPTTTLPTGRQKIDELMNDRGVMLKDFLIQTLAANPEQVYLGPSAYNDRPQGPRLLISPMTVEAGLARQEAQLKYNERRLFLRGQFDRGEETQMVFEAYKVAFKDLEKTKEELTTLKEFMDPTFEVFVLTVTSMNKQVPQAEALLNSRLEEAQRVVSEVGLDTERIRWEVKYEAKKYGLFVSKDKAQANSDQPTQVTRDSTMMANRTSSKGSGAPI